VGRKREEREKGSGRGVRKGRNRHGVRGREGKENGDRPPPLFLA